ncbi:MAG: stage II sporulation protein R [Gemmiger sp.]|nr:stage II sporulation protein R [Gemmiger sp.]
MEKQRAFGGYTRHQRAALVGLAAGFLLTLVATLLCWRYQAACQAVCRDTLRLHILANSDSMADQALKLSVRDAILAELAPVMAGAADKTQAIGQVQAALPALRRAALRTLQAAHSTQTVTLRVEQQHFAAKTYAGFALPAGVYTALRVELGQGAGHNWFCVLYPALCVGAAEGRYPTEAENALVFGGYELRFALFDTARAWWQQAGQPQKSTAPATPETAAPAD